MSGKGFPINPQKRLLMPGADPSHVVMREELVALQTQLASLQTLKAASEPAGVVKMWAGNYDAIPAGWLLCDGSAVSRATYAALFGALGVKFGAGDASTTFNLPTTQQLMPRGAPAATNPGGTGGSTAYTPAGTVGAVTITGSTAAEASHTHSVTAAGTVVAPTMSGSTAAEASHTHSVTAAGTNANESSHTHSVTSNVAVANHASHSHTITQGAFGTDLFTENVVTGLSAYVSGGTCNANTGNPSVTLTHTVTNNAVTSGAGSAHTHTFTGSAVTSGAGSSHSHGIGTIAASAPAFTGSGVTSGAGSSHLHAVGTLAGNAPSFTGTPATIQPPYVDFCFIIKT